MKSLLSNSRLYFLLRNFATGGIPYQTWIRNLEINNPEKRILDLGAGTCDIYKFLGDQPKAEFVLGIDYSEEYLKTAEKNLSESGINYKLFNIDLEKLDSDSAVRTRLIELIKEYNINHVVLIGVLHHLPDEPILNTLNILHSIPSVQSVYALDVIFNDNAINNMFSRMDRGEYVRTEAEYQTLLNKSQWSIQNKVWSNPKIRQIRYLQHNLVK